LIPLLKIILILAALSFASYQDLKTREIDDKVWYIAIVTGAVLTASEILTTPGYPLALLILSVGITAVLALGIYYAGLYGGADAKALIAIAVTLPLPPSYQAVTSWPYPFTIFGNALVLSLLLIPACAIWNSLWWMKNKDLFKDLNATTVQKAAIFFLGAKVKLETANKVHFNLLEKLAADGSHYIRLFSRVASEEEPKVFGKDSKYVWATPALPLIVFFLFGFLLYFVAGDIIFRIVLFLMGAMA